MADFCRECSIDLFGEDLGELAGLCKPGESVSALCEGCGALWVDHEGSKIAPDATRPLKSYFDMAK